MPEPTYSPTIELTYPDEEMQVRAYAFLNDGDDVSLAQASRKIDTFEFAVEDKWIYPMSGVVFTIDTTHKAKS